MNCIVDTHYLIWSLDDPGKIKPALARILLDSNSTKFVSKISLWEIALKFSLGKLDLKGLTPEDILAAARRAGFQIMDIDEDDLATSHRLPFAGTHKDPFDRLIVWQCIRNDLSLMSADERIRKYTPYGLKIC